MRRIRLLAAATALLVLAAGCGADEAIRIEGAWARTSPAMAEAGAVYFDVTATDADRLIGAAVDASIAGVVEIHETVMAEMGEDGGEGQEGMGAMRMQEVGAIDLPAGETVSLKPGGLHIMLLGLPAPLEVGQTFDVTLTFEEAGEVVAAVEVRDQEP